VFVLIQERESRLPRVLQLGSPRVGLFQVEHPRQITIFGVVGVLHRGVVSKPTVHALRRSCGSTPGRRTCTVSRKIRSCGQSVTQKAL